jgi:outer membrane murein-binding lipoprotein Lpp
MSGTVSAATVDELEKRTEELSRQLEQTEKDLEAARKKEAEANEKAEQANAELIELRKTFDERAPVEDAKIQFGPVTIGGAMRVNYVLGSYVVDDPAEGPNRSGNTGNIELDTFRVNMTLAQNNWIGALEYRWYSDYGKSFPASYSFLHTGWLGYQFDKDNHVEVGLNRVPFGPGPYGIAKSYMFDMHYYLGLADDMDVGVKYVTNPGDWKFDLAYYLRSEHSFLGRSLDSTRYSFDVVRWNESVDDDGNVIYGGQENGFDERNQFNLRAIRSMQIFNADSELGVSLQYGQLKGKETDDGDHWAASAHMINRWGNIELASQLTRYEYRIDSDNPWQTDRLVPTGAFDFAWFLASEAWVPAVSLSFSHAPKSIAWIDKIVPYIEYSHVIKDESSFNDSQMFAIGSQFYRGGWLVYTDLILSNGNWFIGNEADDGKADNYNRVDGVGDWGANGNNRWNTRFTINFGYYF